MNEVIDIHGTPHQYRSGDTLPLSLNDIVARRRNDIAGGGIFQILASANGELFNPLISGHSISKRDQSRGGRYFRLTKCSQDCYRSYVTFLRLKNRTHFVLAQRRLLNGYR